MPYASIILIILPGWTAISVGFALIIGPMLRSARRKQSMRADREAGCSKRTLLVSLFTTPLQSAL